MSPILGIYASQMSGHLWPASSYESIATTTVGSGGSSTITFSSIPSTYSHLQIRYTARYTGAVAYDALRIRLNSDTGNNYTNHYLLGDGASMLPGTDAPFSSLKYLAYVVGNNGTANNFSSGVIDILDYANTNKYKTARSLTGYDNNGSGLAGMGSGAWMSTSAISSIQIAPYGSGSSYAQYSSFALYGIKAI